MNEDKEKEQKHIIPRRIIKSMSRQDVLAHQNNSLIFLFCISWTCKNWEFFSCKFSANNNW